MNIGELIEQLSVFAEKVGRDAEVLAQSGGCCMHGHEIESVELGGLKYDGVNTPREVGCVVIRV